MYFCMKLIDNYLTDYFVLYHRRCARASDGVSATLVSLVSLVTFATLNRTRTSSSAPCPRSSPCRDQSQTPPRT